MLPMWGMPIARTFLCHRTFETIAEREDNVKMPWSTRNPNRLCLIGLLALITLVALLLSWPLPPYAAQGIPYGARNPEHPPIRYNIAGDHLQLIHHFELVYDMLTGKIPWFHNVYEFNVAGDPGTYRPGAYFLPLSGVYAILRLLMDRPLAYNLTWIFSLWLSVLFTWAWLSAFSKDRIAICLGILIALLVPFRWFSLFSGSPAGMAVCWVSLLAWRVDRAIRNPNWLSGAWVGLALLLAFWGDLHIIYFAALALPAIAGLTLLSHIEQGHPLPWRQWYKIVPSGSASLGIVVAYHLWRRHLLDGSMMGEGRTIAEVAAFSPFRSGLLGLGRTLDTTIFIGLLVMLTLVLLSIHLIYQSLRSLQEASSRYRLATLALLWAAILSTIILALGVNNPFQTRFLEIVRTRIPYYAMIRQPFKIYALMPIWLGCLATLGWTALPRFAPRLRWILAALLAVGMIAEMYSHFGPTVSLLQPEQDTYAHVVQDAQQRGQTTPRAMVIPLWPGESADTSVPILHAHHYGIRLINGYSPVISRKYFENIFRRLESINQGWLRQDQIDFLLEHDVQYILLHENQFPEQVSPHPVALTRDLLLAHPHLTLLHHAGPVWAFRIRHTPTTTSPTLREVPRFPTRLWSFASQGTGTGTYPDPATHTGQSLRLTPDAPTAQSPIWRMPPAPARHWLLRVKGNATIAMNVHWNDASTHTDLLSIDAEQWHWIEHPLPSLPDFGPVQLHLQLVDGTCDLDIGLVAMGPWPGLDPETQTWMVPAADFFRAGMSEIAHHSVTFRPLHEMRARIFYGPRLPLSPGDYDITLYTSSPEQPGSLLGEWEIAQRGGTTSARQEVRAGHPARIRWAQDNALLVELGFYYNRQSETTIDKVIFTRIPSPEREGP